jgi:plastocyanin
LGAGALVVLSLAGCGGGASSGSSGGGYATPPAGTSSGGTSSASGTTVVEKNFAFAPATLDVKVGDTVTFKNEDSAPHNVKIDGKELGNQDPGASVTWTADKAGSFPYSCTIHPSMTGEIVVK